MAKNITKESKLKLKDVVDQNFIMAVTELSQKDIPAKSAYWLGKSIRKLQTVTADFDKVRSDALKKYAKLKEDGSLELDEIGNAIFKDSDCQKKFVSEIEELLEQEVDVLLFSFSAIDSEEIKINGQHMAALDKFLY